MGRSVLLVSQSHSPFVPLFGVQSERETKEDMFEDFIHELTVQAEKMLAEKSKLQQGCPLGE